MFFLNEILPLFLMIFLGYGLVYFKVLNQEASSVLTALVFYAIIPPTIFITLAKVSSPFGTYDDYMVSYFVTSVILITFSWLVSKFYFNRSSGELVINLMGSSQANTVYLAIPIFLQIFHDVTPVTLIILVQTIFTILFLLGFEKSLNKRLSMLSMIISNPLLMAIFMGLFFNVLSIPIPRMLDVSCVTISDSATFIALVSLGVSLADPSAKMLRKEKEELLFLILFKSLIHPILGYIVGRVWGLEGVKLSMLVLMCSMPTAKNLFIFAQQYHVGISRSNWLVFLTTVSSIVVIPVVMYLMIV